MRPGVGGAAPYDGGGGRRPPSESTPRPAPAQHQHAPMGYPAPAPPSGKGAPPPSPSAPHQLAQGAAPAKTPAAAPAAAASSSSPAKSAASSSATSAADPACSSSATTSAVDPTSSSSSSATSSAATPTSSSSSATTAASPASSSSYYSATSAAALTKEVENKLLVPDALVPEAAAGKGFVAHPARPAARSVDNKNMVRARHSLADNAADNEPFRYELAPLATPNAEKGEVVNSQRPVPKLSSDEQWCHLHQLFHKLTGAVNPELKSEKKKSRQTRKKVFSELLKLHGKACLQKLPVNGERKSLYSEGSIPFRSENPAEKDEESHVIFTVHKALKRMSSRLARKLKKIGGKMIQNEKYSDHKFAQEFGAMVCSELLFGAACVLPPPQLKCQNLGREKTCTPSVGNSNITNKMSEIGILTETETGPSLEFLRHGNEHRYFKVGSQHSSATFTNQHHLSVLNDPVPPERTVEVNVCVGRVKIPMHANLTATVGELVQDAVLKRNIRVKDEYFVLNGRNIDKDCKLSSLPVCDGSCISVNPRMRGGGEVELKVVYQELGDLLARNRHLMFESVWIPKNYNRSQRPTQVPFWGTFSQYIIHHLLFCICRDGHEKRKVCWEGRFDIGDILIARGHIRIHPRVREVKYHPNGGRADYAQLHDIIWNQFLHPSNGAVPMHASHLLRLLQNTADNLRQDRDFITFLINHPSLLSCSDRVKLYSQVDQKIRRLGKKKLQKFRELTIHMGLGWQAAVRSVAGFQQTYMYKARVHPVTNVRTSVYTHEADQCLHFCRNFLNHLKPGVTLEVAEAALVNLLNQLLSQIVLKLIVSFKSLFGWNIARTIENTNADITSLVFP